MKLNNNLAINLLGNLFFSTIEGIVDDHTQEIIEQKVAFFNSCLGLVCHVAYHQSS